MAVHSCLLVILSSISAAALEPSLDFEITDEASYQSFREAISKTEYVRNAYIQDPKPRVIGAAAGLLHYATDNPLASDTQLTAFLAEYVAKLAAHAPGDADLQRGSHLVSAIRFELPLASVVGLVGTNTNLGQEIVDLLGIDVPPPDGFQTNERRIVRFEQARLSTLSESPAWANLLTIGFSGQDLLGDPNPNLAGVLQTYLEGEGYSPFAPTCGGCTDVVGGALAALPVDYFAYQTLLADPFATGGIWNDVIVGFEAVNQESIDRLDELAVIMTNEPSLVQAAANANDVAFVAQREAAYVANLAKVADERTIINMNAMLLAQAPDASTRALGEKAQRFAKIQIGQNSAFAAAGEGVQILGGVAGLAFEFAKGKKKDPVALVGGAVDLVTGALGLGSLFGGGEDDDAAEQMIIDQIVEMRDQLSDVQFQLNGRFDRIDTQLNTVYTALFDGFAFVGTQLDDLQTNLANANATLEDLERDLAQASASLDRIEEALWTIGDALLENDLALITDGVLNYRASNGVDLSYQNFTPNFVTGMSNLFTFATTTAINDIYAGDDPSTLTVESAASDLSGASIGRQINDLRVFPTNLGQSPLLGTRVPAPSLWAQSASAYAQVARENPWYFAFMYENQLFAPGAPDLDNIIDIGQDLDSLASNARNQALFDALFDAWRTALQPVTSLINQRVVAPMIISDVFIANDATDVAISGNLALVHVVNGGLQVIDISDPAMPVVLGTVSSFALGGSASGDIVIAGDLALVATFFDGLKLIDISDPTLPVVVQTVPTAGRAYDLATHGDLAFVVDADTPSLLIIDISDPTAPITIGNVSTTGFTTCVATNGDLALVSYSFGFPDSFGLWVIDVGNPTNPVIVGSVPTPASVSDVAISGNLAFVADGDAGLLVISLSDPTAPIIIGSVPATALYRATDVAIVGDLAFVTNAEASVLYLGDEGLQVIDISDPTNPIIVGSVSTPSFAIDVATSGDLAYVVDGTGLQVIDIFNLDVLDELATDPLLVTTQTNLLGYQKLIESYITLGMPELMEESPIVRAALRSDATESELAVGPVIDIVSGYISSPDISIFPWGQVAANLQLLQDEVDAAIANPSVGHGYVDYMLAELEHLKDNAFRLAIDDAYYTPFGATLSVPASAGLLANDVGQQFRNIQVALLVAPQNGSLNLLADGSFVYTPAPGVGGPDSFTYRACTEVAISATAVCSDPTTVVVVAGFTVSSTNDTGVGSLRATIADTPAGEVIHFSGALDGQTILLISQLDLTQDVTLDASNLPNGLTLDGGGATRVLHVASGVIASIAGLTITGGRGGNGGGIQNDGGILSLVDVSLIANEASFYGGGIINFGGTLNMTGTTVAGNIAGFGGAGLYNGNSFETVSKLINSTLEGNTSNGSDGGGGIQNYLGEVNLIHTTIVGNDSSVSLGGGIRNNGGTLIVENSIVAGNTADTIAADFVSNTTVLTAGQNLIGDNEGVQAEFPIGLFAGTAANPVDPMLNPLADNGGPTLTMLPRIDSPAIDAAVPEVTSPLADQRGTLRPQGPHDDIGSVEYVPEPAAAIGMIPGVLLLAFLARRREQATRST